MAPKVRSHGVQLLVLAVLGAGVNAFVHPTTGTDTTGSGRTFGKTTGFVPSFDSALTHPGADLGHSQRKSVVLNEGLSLLDQLITTTIFAAGVYATIQKADKWDDPSVANVQEEQPVTAEKSESVAVVERPTPAPASEPAPAKSPVAVATPKKESTEETPEVSDTSKKSGGKRRLAGKVVKKLVMPWRSFDDL